MKYHAPFALAGSLFLVSALLCTALPSTASAEGEIEKVATEDPVLDRNGDGFQDVIVNRKRVHYDVDFDGQFDYTLSLYLSEYKTDAHKRYIASGCDPKVFDEITVECLDELCATSREEARWYENNFSTFTYYDGWYTRLYVFADSPMNDGRLTSKKHKGEYEYWVTFNPDGTIKTVKKGDAKVSLAEFDAETKTSSGKKMTLPAIKTKEDMDRVRAEIASLF
jgi:hypothetical protein